MITRIFIDSYSLDLFEDENIKVKSAVSKIEDITKIFTDTSNNFTIPASDNNLEAINHWYESDIVNGFDARKKVPALIELNGISYKFGKIKLNKVNFKHGQPDNISIGYFGNLVDLKDTLGDDKLTDLDLSDLNFDYNYANVVSKLYNISDVSFSLLSDRRLLYDSLDIIDDTDTQANIYYNGIDGDTGLRISDLKGSIKQLKIIEAIEDKYSLKFSRDFFGLYDFSNQFIAISGTKNTTPFQVPLGTPDYGVDPTVVGDTMMVEGLGTPFERYTSSIELSIYIKPPSERVKYNVYIVSDDKIVARKDGIVGSIEFGDRLKIKTTDVEGGFKNVTFWIESSEPINFDARCYRFQGVALSNAYSYVVNGLSSIVKFKVSKRLPNIKTLDYLKGLFKMYKLVAIPQNDGTIYVDSLVNYYSKGNVIDFSKWIDYSSHTVSNGKILKEIKYKFQEPQTILNQQFKKLEGVGYGDLEHSIYNDNENLIDGDSLDFELPFEQIVYEKIQDIGGSVIDTNIQYGLLLDESLETVDIKPHIHYIQKRVTDIKILNDDNVGDRVQLINVPSHVLDFSLQTYSTVFGNEFNEFDGAFINNTLFSNYHQQFIENVFNSQKREYVFKAKNVPDYIIQSLQLNDIIEIKDKFYRIDEYTVNTINSDVDLKLFNVKNIGLGEVIPLTADNTVLKADNTRVTASNNNTTKEELEPVIPS